MVGYKLYSVAPELADKVNWMYYSRGEAWSPEFDVAVFQQKGREIYLGNLPAHWVDAISFVPEINSEKKYDQMADHLLGDPEEEWQRSLKGSRISRIGDFWADSDKYIVNPVILGVRDATYDFEVPDSRADGSGNLDPIEIARIKLDPWQTDTCPRCGRSLSVAWADLNRTGDPNTIGAPAWLWGGESVFGTRCPDMECSGHMADFPNNLPPLYLIDGQHRVRGLNHRNADGMNPGAMPSGKWYEEKIGFSLIRMYGENRFNTDAQPRIFSDINTMAQELDPRHKMYMLWKFGLSAEGIKDRKYNFGNVDLSGLGGPTEDRVAYEACLRLIGVGIGVDGTGNPVSNRIAPIVTHGEESEFYYVRTIMPLDKLFNHIRGNMVTDGIFAGYGRDDIARIMLEYLEAVREIWDSVVPGGGHTYLWTPTRLGTAHPIPMPYDPVAAETDEQASERLWNNPGIISTPSRISHEQTTPMILLLELMSDVVWLTGWVPGAARPTKASMQIVLDNLSTCAWTGDGWRISASTDQVYVVDVLRDHLYDSVGGPYTANRFGGVIPDIAAADDLSNFITGCPVPAPSGVESEMAELARRGNAAADINDFLTKEPQLRAPFPTGPWGAAGAGGRPQVQVDSALLIHIPINTHGNMRIQFDQEVAPGDVRRKVEVWKCSRRRYRLVRSYQGGVGAGHRTGVGTLVLRDGSHYDAAAGGKVRVIISAGNSSSESGENDDFWFDI